MGDVLVRQNLSVLVAKNPTASGNPVTERDFAVDPAEQTEDITMNEDAGARFQVPASGSLTLGLDSVAAGKALFIRVEAACGLVVTNGLGSSPTIQLVPGRTSAMWMEFTGLQLVNAGGTAVKGRYCVVGD